MTDLVDVHSCLIFLLAVSTVYFSAVCARNNWKSLPDVGEGASFSRSVWVNSLVVALVFLTFFPLIELFSMTVFVFLLVYSVFTVSFFVQCLISHSGIPLQLKFSLSFRDVSIHELTYICAIIIVFLWIMTESWILYDWFLWAIPLQMESIGDGDTL
eukprot:TRINITY_DN3214_c0_g1_i18.p1 TRINITY_DN3214_c0_g1~~TRINITY_DN3214_c0_g1_i18.p1  ORF type:complete len:157 (+),score=2.55 TRINITY_DN3214_c0_g1_i18:61-531(+)